MKLHESVAVMVACICVVLAIALPIAIVAHNSTERLRACVSSGGEYVHVTDTTVMECKR